MRVVLAVAAAAAVGLLASLGARPSWGGSVEPVRLPDGSVLPAVDFDRHVASLLGRLGCNAGSCHGSFQGRGGLTLSLFGHDPVRDFRALTRDAQGRRVNVLDPDRSLLLLKATGRVPHEGGQRLTPGSWEYHVLRTWIAGGARRDPTLPAAERIEVKPEELTLDRPGRSTRLAVSARLADGTRVDVTPFCEVRVKDEAVSAVAHDGTVRGLRAGDTAVVVSYRGLLASARVTVPTGRAVEIPEVPGTNLVDREVDARLRVLGVPPSGPSSDTEFLRRVTLDTIGTLPTPGEVRLFLADSSADRRQKKVDALLAHPAHAALWATRFLDITGCDVAAMEGPPDLAAARARMWHQWLCKRFAANEPYDRLARGVVCATSRSGDDVRKWLEGEAARLSAAQAGRPTDYADRPALDQFWRRFANNEFATPELMAERTAVAFLGVRMECAACHKHPFDRWTQADYRAFAATFAKVGFGLSPDGLAAAASLLEERRAADPNRALPPIPRLREVYVSERPVRRLTDPETGRPLPPRAPGGPVLGEDGDPRERLFAWMTRPDNPYFARSLVNRVWAAYFGAGLVDPVDNLSVANPPSNGRLLDAMADDFVAHGYDLRRLERLVLTSRAYQRSSEPVEGNRDDRGHFATAKPRLMMAEVLVDTLNAALGLPAELGPDAPPGARAVEVATNRVTSPDLARAFRVFGRPERTSTCDCERPREPTLAQVLFLMTDSALQDRLRRGRVARLVAAGLGDTEAVDELFLAALSRFPDADETRAALDHLRNRTDRTAALSDVLWALINTREFVLNH